MTSKSAPIEPDIRDVGQALFDETYAKYLAALGRPAPDVVHRQDRSVPGIEPPN
jgi:hypothetical protein